MAKKYVRENGLVKAINTDSLQLEKPLANEHYNIQIVNSNMDKIDLGYKQNKDSIESLMYEIKESSNTQHSTANGTKEFTCKSGYVDNVKIEGKTKILDANNVECQPGTTGAKLVSVGQGDKIEVLSYKGDTIPFTFENGWMDLNNGQVGASGSTNLRTNDYVNVVGVNYIYCTKLTHILLYDSNKTFIKSIRDVQSGTYVDLKNVSYIKLWTVAESSSLKILSNSECDKKQISTTLRSLLDGVKDEIVKQGSSYYKLQKCEEVVLNSDYVIALGHTAKDVIRFNIYDAISDGSSNSNIAYCDKFKHNYAILGFECNEIGICKGVHQDRNVICISIEKSRISSQDVEGFKAWLKANPVTVVYELETPKLIPLPNFNPQTFGGKTTFLLNTGVIQGEADFEVTNSLGSALDVMADKVSSLDDSVNPKSIDFTHECTFFNGWNRWGNETYFKAYMVGNHVKVRGLFATGVLDKYSLWCKIPTQYSPISSEYIASMGSDGSSYSIVLNADGEISPENDISQNSAWVSINFSYPLPRK